MIDLQGFRRGMQPFAIYGMNAITVYALSGILADLLGLTGASSWLWQNAFAHTGDPRLGSLLYALGSVLALYLVAWYMHRRNWFVRF
jgi:predicted acyltransferase